MPPSVTPHRLQNLLPRYLAVAVLVVGIGISIVMAVHTRALIDSEAQAVFDHAHEKLKDEVHTRFMRPRYGLRGARGVYAASKSVERHEFQAYVASRDLPEEFPGILGIGVIKPVARAELASFITAERADDAPDFTVTTHGTNAQCYVITSIYPQAANQRAWGFDAGSESIRRSAIEEAISSGQTTMTHCISLVQDEERSPGFLLLQPIYHNGSSAHTPDERRATVDVLVYASIRAVDLLEGLDHAGMGKAIATVWEDASSSPEAGLYPLGGRPPLESHFSAEDVLQIHGRNLHLRVSSTPALDAAWQSYEPTAILSAGALVSCLLALTTLWLGGNLVRMLASQKDMSGSLQNALREADAYRSALDRFAIVSMTDSTGRIISINDAFCAISGYSREELLGHDHRMINSGHHQASFWKEMWSTIQSGKSWRGIVRNRRKDGSLYWVDSMIAPFTNSDGTIQRFVSIRFDITALVAAQEETRRLSESLEMALMGGEVGTWDLDVVEDKLVWDDRMYQLYGISRACFGGAYETWHACVHPADKTRVGHLIEKVFRGEAKFDTDFRITWPDGSLRYIRARAQVRWDADGRAVRMLGTNWDITREREAVAEMARLRSILDKTPDVIAMANFDGQLDFLNHAGRDLLGLKEDADVTGVQLAQLHPGWANAKTRNEGIPAVIAHDIWQCETAVLHRDGTEIPVSKVLLLHRQDDGQPGYLSTILRDLRPQKRIESDLRQLATLHQGILDSANIAVIAGDTAGLITVWNAAATHMLGWTSNEMVGRQTPAVIHLESEVVARARVLSLELGKDIAPGFDAFVAKTTMTGQPDENEWTYVRKDGSHLPVLLSVTALRDATGSVTGYLGIAVDITERNRHQQELRAAMVAAEAGARAKAEFLATMSHEIRTPMNGVIGMTELLARTPLDPQQIEYTQAIQTCGENLLILINDILHFSKLEAGRVELERIPFSLRQLVEEVCRLFSPQATAKGVTISHQLDQGEGKSVIGDPTRLRQVLLNLVSNALKFTLKGSVRIVLKTQTLADGNCAITLSIHDTGVGMSPEQIAHLGEAFSQADPSTTRRFGGTGLGMTISKSLIRLMNGSINVESQSGIGSVFHVNLVLPEATVLETSTPAVTSIQAPAEAPSLILGRVLVADDNTINRRVMQGMLRKYATQVDLVENGSLAVEAVKSRSYDCVLMDCEMPEMDGYEATRSIREREQRDGLPRLLIIALTAHAMEEARAECLAAGMDDYLSKPIRDMHLREAFERHVGMPRNPPSPYP